MNPTLPKISFTFPYRWLTDEEDKKYLVENLRNQAKRSGLNLPMHERLLPQFINQYAVVLKYHAFQPVKVNLAKVTIEKAFSELIPGAKLLSYNTFFVQKTQNKGLPVMEMEIYY